MKRIIYVINDYFGFSQNETNGFLVLMTILVILLIAPSFLQVNSNYTPEQAARDQFMLDSMNAVIAQQHVQAKPQKVKQHWVKKTPAPVKRVLSLFNPNTAPQADFEKLGVPRYLAKRICKYRSKGGMFHVKKDLKKIYGFPEGLYNELEDYIQLPNQLEKKETLRKEPIKKVAENVQIEKKNNFVFKKPVPFDLALADTSELKRIKGIGSKLSARIVSFRDKLGGFHSLHQLDEIYGLKPEVVEELKKYALLENPELVKISINKASAEALRKHPYISYKLANVIVSYRDQHGAYAELNDLKKIRLVKQDFILKIAPYLSFD